MTKLNSEIRSVLILGCGYLGLRVAERWQQAGVHVSAMTRSPETAAQFAAAGWDPIQMDLASPSTAVQLPKVDAVLWAVGYDRSAGVAREVVWIDGLKWVLENLQQPLKKFIYISSTGVYGNVEEEIVTEDTTARPVTEGGESCLRAEQLVLEYFQKWDSLQSGKGNQQGDASQQDTAVILRLAGIYGPDRLLRRIMDLKSQVPLPGEPDHWLNLIHVDDAVSLVMKMAELQTTEPVVNVANTETVVRQRYYEKLAELSHASSPVFGAANATGRARSANKKVTSKYNYDQLAKFKFNNVLEGLDDAFSRSTIVT